MSSLFSFFFLPLLSEATSAVTSRIAAHVIKLKYKSKDSHTYCYKQKYNAYRRKNKNLRPPISNISFVYEPALFAVKNGCGNKKREEYTMEH